MKVDADLRVAIRAAVRCQGHLTWQDKLAIQQKAIAELLKRKPTLKRKYTATLKRLAKLNTERDRVKAELDSLGFTLEAKGNPGKVFSVECFAKQGGNLPENYDQRFTEAQVVSELASAPEKRRQEILKKYGLDWN